MLQHSVRMRKWVGADLPTFAWPPVCPSWIFATVALLTLCAGIGESLLQFSVPVYTVTIPETPAEDSDVFSGLPNTPVTGGVALNASCRNNDSDSREIRYSILEGAGVGTFSLNELTGQFSIADQPFNYEEQPQYLVSLLCYLDSNTSNNATAAVIVTVGNINEYLPRIYVVGSTTLTIPESTPNGTRIAATDPSIGPLLTYAASDRDTGPDSVIFYYLEQNTGVFELDNVTGTLTLRGVLDIDDLAVDFERLEIDITACNENITRSQCNSLSFTLFITPANDNAPHYERSNYNVSLMESAPTGSLVVQTVCIDEDHGLGSTLSYLVHVDTPQVILDTFQLTSSGAVLLLKSLDFEEGVMSYQFQVVCSDGDNKARALVRVDVSPVNDNPPVFAEERYEFSVERSSPVGHRVGQVQAEDGDIGTGTNISYSIDGSTDFKIGSHTGEITLNNHIPSTEGSRFEFEVLASDGLFQANTTVLVLVRGAVSMPEFAAIIAGVCIFFLLVMVTIFFFGICCFCHIRTTRTRAYAVERATMSADITSRQKSVRFVDEVTPNEPLSLVVANQSAQLKGSVLTAIQPEDQLEEETAFVS